MRPMDVLDLVRRGFAVATAEQARILAGCVDVDVIAGEWAPRWALEAEYALAQAGLAEERMAAVFASGRKAIHAELQALVAAGRRRSVLEARDPWRPLPFDRRTRATLLRAVGQHRATCAACARADACEDAQELADEIELLFPRERRRQPRR